MKLMKVKKLVEEALEFDIRARNDDRILIFLILRKILYGRFVQYDTLVIPRREFLKFPSFEAIIRARAKIQNVEKRFLPTNETVRQRREQQKKYRTFVTGESS
jgi:hypothetical protein